jgi:putative membrane protein insertion efficiency factor
MPSSAHRPSIPARLAERLVRGYQVVLSPLLRCLGPYSGCRFAPSCSEYARQALLAHGLWRGAWMAAGRIARCQPFHPGGVDPVPQPGRYTLGRMWRPRVER